MSARAVRLASALTALVAVFSLTGAVVLASGHEAGRAVVLVVMAVFDTVFAVVLFRSARRAEKGGKP